MLNAKQRKCIELMVLGTLKQVEIAEQVEISENTICNWKKNTEFIAEYQRLLNLSIKSAAAKAFNTHKALLDSKSDMVRYLAAKDILDRAGFKPEEKINIDGGVSIVIHDDI